MHSTGQMIGVSLALSLGTDFPNLAMYRAPPEKQKMFSAAVAQGALDAMYTGSEGSLSLFPLGGGVCSPSLQPECSRQWRPITLHVEQFGSDFTLPGRTKAVPGEPVLLEQGC